MTTSVTVSSLVLYATDLEKTAAFYRAIGVPLDHETHDDGPAHFAAELDGVHFAIHAGSTPDRPDIPPWRSAGSAFPGFYVDSLATVVATLAAERVVLLAEHETMPWGCRVVAVGPDGRAIEINERGHCPVSGPTPPG